MQWHQDWIALDDLNQRVRNLETQLIEKASDFDVLQCDYNTFRSRCTCQNPGNGDELDQNSSWVVEEINDVDFEKDFAECLAASKEGVVGAGENFDKNERKEQDRKTVSLCSERSDIPLEPSTEHTMEFVSVPEKVQLLRTAVGSETITWEVIQQSVKSFVLDQAQKKHTGVNLSEMSPQAEEVLTLIARLDSLEGESIVQTCRKSS